MDDRSAAIDLDRADAYGLAFADVYDRWYHHVTDAEATASFVAARTCGGPALELGVGSGRLARPLAGRGVPVVGVDGSAEMLDRCRVTQAEESTSGSNRGPAIPGGSLHLIRADMRALPLRGPFGSALIAFNTLFNLGTEAEQKQLLADLAVLIGPDGSIVVEAIDVTALLDGPTRSLGVRDTTDDGVVLTATQLDRDRQVVNGQHIEVDHRGVRLRPWRLRWLTPTQLDHLADRAGLRLAERYGSWDSAPYTSSSDTLVSVYHRQR